jgi:hypothetical protein
MKRNSALRGLAWFSVLVIANATPISAILQIEAAKGLLALYAEHPMPAGDVATGAWWITCAVLTGFAIWLGRVFVSVWGEQGDPEPDHRAANLGLQAVAGALDPTRSAR